MNKIKTAPIEKWYRRIGRVSVGAVLFLILVGGIVRSTGSGMGCPDWPKCFGVLVPPTDVADIPAQFFEQHPDYQTKTFNVFQTWTEYINRLIGALIGLFVLITAVLSIGFFRKDRRIPILSFGAVILTGFQGWLGKLVVDKNLEGGMVTIHMLVAMIILAVLITAVYFAEMHRKGGPARSYNVSSGFAWLSVAMLSLTLIQILIGTQVREAVDAVAVAMNDTGRETWVDQLGGYYSIHRSLWIVVAGLIVYWTRKLIRDPAGNPRMRFFAYVLLATLGLEVLMGMFLGSFALPAVAQPIHLLLAAVMFAAEYALVVNVLGIERFGHKQMKLEYHANRQLANAKQ
ncbi:MAG: COX15/CtaA family protein [Bacteroidota bacterium]